MDYQKFIQASQQLERAAAKRRRSITTTLEREVQEALDRGERGRAANEIRAYLGKFPGAARWWHELAVLQWQGDDREDALMAWRRALASADDDIPLLSRIAEGLRAAGFDPAALASEAWSSRTAASDTAIAAKARLRTSDLQEACRAVLHADWKHAEQIFTRMMYAQPGDARTAENLAFVLQQQNRHGTAQCVNALHLLVRGQATEAVEAFEAAPHADARSEFFLGEFIRALRVVGDEGRAIEILETIEPAAITAAVHIEWANILVDLGSYEEGIRVLERGADARSDPSLALQALLILPAVPSSQMALEQAHYRVRQNMLSLATAPLPESAESLASLERGLGPNFFLPFMGDPCVEEASAYGRYAERVMRARYPHIDPPDRHRSADEPIRVGCATSFVNHHVVMKCFAGWLQRADRQAFQIHLFPLASEQNQVTDYLARLVDVFHPPSLDTEEAARQIRAADLDVLAYPEIGIDPLSFRLAAMRLAPVQCAAAGHPMTTGLPTIDYFLSAAAAEPPDAPDHYTEQLVTLPGMGICMPMPEPPSTPLERADLGLPADRVIYLSSQNLFKHLPRHDEVYARIAESVEDSLFVFVEGYYPAWTCLFRRRMEQCFTARGLSAERYIHFVPRQNYENYLSLNAVSDVFLDPPGGFSGGMTSRDALACGLPIVTAHGNLMRNRQSLGLLRELGLEHLVANDLDAYVALAIALGQDEGQRSRLSRMITARRSAIFEDTTCVDALEDFFRWATAREQMHPDALFRLHPLRV